MHVKAMLDLVIPETDSKSRVFWRPLGDPEIGYVHAVIRCIHDPSSQQQQWTDGTERTAGGGRDIEFCLRVGQVRPFIF